jgi:nitrogen fixation/metabolism regulation signal transduction histidine kinase
MTDSRIRFLLFLTIFVMCALPLAAAFYFMDDALRRSLNLGFNPQIVRALDIGAQDLKILKNLDSVNESRYRAQFEEIQNLKRVYEQPQWVKGSILGSLRIYFGLGLAAAVLLSISVAALLSRRISHSYQVTFNELIVHRERIRYLEEMSSWQEMAKALAHEIKNPLTPIEVLITSLTKSHLSKTPQEFAAQLRQTQSMVGEEISHLKRTVSRFSDFAKLPQAQLIEANPVHVIEQQLPAVMARFENARVTIQTSDTDANLRARMDGALFRQVLMNIVCNGVEANPNRAVAFTIEVTETRSSIQLAISNDGEPVPATIAARIFDPYISGKAGGDNMGLGLAIVKKIIIEHEGEIRYAAHANHPRFTISLPRVS